MEAKPHWVLAIASVLAFACSDSAHAPFVPTCGDIREGGAAVEAGMGSGAEPGTPPLPCGAGTPQGGGPVPADPGPPPFGGRSADPGLGAGAGNGLGGTPGFGLGGTTSGLGGISFASGGLDFSSGGFPNPLGSAGSLFP